MRHLYFVRHGLSEMNVLGMYAGASDTPLTETGREQARKAGLHIKEKSIPIDVIISSPLSRTLETAQHIASEIGYDHRNISIHHGLIERHFGVLEGTPSKTGPISYKTYTSDPFAFDVIEGAEKISDLQFRANKVLKELRELPHNTVLIVSHGAFGRALNRAIHKLPITEFGTSFENAQIVKLI
jgi:broad specificity phosphatase PhoE